MRLAMPALLALAAAALPARAQVRPHASEDNPHVQSIDYKADQVVRLDVVVGYQLLIEFSSDDPIVNVAIGDPAAWQATASRSGDRLYLQATQAGNPTNMTVVTTNRRYLFDLSASSGSSAAAPYVVRFHHTAPDRDAASDVAQPIGRYKLSGARDLRPSAISDDGIHTSIMWPPAAAMPAVFVHDKRGDERIAGGHMRGGVYVVDAINPVLIFRIDDRTARADRVLPRRTEKRR